MTFNYEEWEAGMRRNHGDNWRDLLREGGRKGGRVKTDKGYSKMDPERHRGISSQAGKASQEARRKRNAGQ